MSETEVQPAAAATGNDDVRADVAAAFAALSAGEPAAQDAPAIEADEPEQNTTTERLRNERGQFTKADGAEPAAEPAPVTDADPIEDKPEPVSPPVAPPTSWSADAKAEWSKLSPALQQAVLKRETEINEGGRRWSEERRAYDEMLAPVREQARRAGIDEREGIQRLIAASDYLERDPANAIKALAQAYGVDLSGATPTASAVDPRLNSLSHEVGTLRSVIETRERSEAMAEIQRFAAAPGHEHFEAVKEEMGRLISTGVASSMNDAYDKAVWSNPDIRTQLLAAQTAQAEAARRADQKAAAEKARRAAISINGSPAGAGAPVAKPEYATVREAVEAAYASHSR